MSAPAPAYLAPDWRYVGDDWTLTYVVYETPPVYAADGTTIVTPGVPQPLAGYSVTGTLSYRSRCAAPAPVQVGTFAMVGAVTDATNGIITLSLDKTQTLFPRQAIETWGDPRRAALVAQPRIVDPTGRVTTVGLQPIFAF